MMTTKTFITKSLEDLSDVAQAIIAEQQYPLVLLIGDLGAGKTTLVKEMLRLLESEDSGGSPSYSIINEYQIKDGKMYHIDLYRLSTVEEAFALGLEDILYSGARCLLEWPQLIIDYLEKPYCIIQIKVDSNDTRTLELSYQSEN